MKCNDCGKQIKKGFRWLNKLWCRKCFELERDRIADLMEMGEDVNIDWNYEIVEETSKSLTYFLKNKY